MLVLLYVDLVQNPKIKIIGRVQTITLTPPKTTETNNEIHIKKIYYWDFTGMWSMYCTGFCNEISSPSENMYARIRQNKRILHVYRFTRISINPITTQNQNDPSMAFIRIFVSKIFQSFCKNNSCGQKSFPFET